MEKNKFDVIDSCSVVSFNGLKLLKVSGKLNEEIKDSIEEFSEIKFNMQGSIFCKISDPRKAKVFLDKIIEEKKFITESIVSDLYDIGLDIPNIPKFLFIGKADLPEEDGFFRVGLFSNEENTEALSVKQINLVLEAIFGSKKHNFTIKDEAGKSRSFFKGDNNSLHRIEEWIKNHNKRFDKELKNAKKPEKNLGLEDSKRSKSL